MIRKKKKTKKNCPNSFFFATRIPHWLKKIKTKTKTDRPERKQRAKRRYRKTENHTVNIYVRNTMIFRYSRGVIDYYLCYYYRPVRRSDTTTRREGGENDGKLSARPGVRLARPPTSTVGRRLVVDALPSCVRPPSCTSAAIAAAAAAATDADAALSVLPPPTGRQLDDSPI